MRVVILGTFSTDKMPGGGAERHILNVVKNLSYHRDIDINVIGVSKEVKRNVFIRVNNFTLYQIRSPSLPMTITAISIDAFRIIRQVIKLNPDIIHGQMLGAPYGLVTALLSNKYKTILTVHSMLSDDVKYKILSFKAYIHDLIWENLEKYELRTIPNFIAISVYLQNELRKNLDIKKKIYFIPNGIDRKWFTNYNEIDGRILFVGRILPVKGIEYLLYAVKNIYYSKKDIKLHIVGPVDDRYYFNKIKKLITELKIDKIVKFQGQMNDEQLIMEYGECSIFVLPSKIETQGIVLLEAMAAGKPVIGFNVGGIPGMIKNGENGFLVEYGDINGLMEKMVELLENKKMRDRMGKAGRDFARTFDWVEISEKTRILYDKVILEGSK